MLFKWLQAEFACPNRPRIALQRRADQGISGARRLRLEHLETRELLAAVVIPYTTDANTLALYHLDDSNGSTTSSDSSGNGLDLSADLSPFSGTSGPGGLSGAAGPFAVTGDPVKELSHAIDNGEAALFDTSSFTVEAWVRNPADYAHHVFQIRGGGARYEFLVGSDQLRLTVDPGNVSEGSNLVTFDPDTWYHVAVTYSQDGADGKVEFYQTKESDIHWGVVQVGSSTISDFTPHPLVDGSSVLRVGGLDGADDRQFNGSIDEFRWSNGVRPPSEMAHTLGVPATFTEVASISGSHLAWGDFNNDGWVDFVKSVVYRNDNGLGFTEAGYSAGGGLWGDLNNDGFLDLFDYHALYSNDEGTGFTNVSYMLPPSLPDSVSRGAALADLNNDGYLDAYMGGYEDWNAGITYPDVILMYNPATQQYDLTWQETVYRARGVTAADFDRDGDQDVYVSNYRLQPNRLWQNDGSGTMTDVAHTYGVAGTNNGGYYGHTIGSAWGDFDNDGWLDLFVGNFSHPASYQDRPQLFRNPGAAGGPFQLMKTFDGADWQESYASPALGDYDNDGDLDLYFTTVYSGDNPRLYHNDGNWNFTDVTSSVGLGGLGATYMAAWADYDNDGDLDLATAGHIYRNNESGNNWLKVRLEGDGKNVNQSAIGAQVRVHLGDEIITRQVEGATGEGNQNDLVLHFGLGSHSQPVDVEILWPDGTTLSRTLDVNQPATVSYYDSPEVSDDNYSTNEDQAIWVPAPGILANDHPGSEEQLTIFPGPDPDNGQIVVLQDGSFAYQPNKDYFGDDSFVYIVYDGIDYSNLATVTITVNPINDPPVAVDDQYSMDQGDILYVPEGVMTNDYDVDSEEVVAILTQSAAYGSMVLQPDGELAYLPEDDFFGADSFNYVLYDGDEVSAVATVTITVHRTAIWGDANLDGLVDDADAALLASHWQQTGVGWSGGDFNGDGTVDDADAALLASHWQEGVQEAAPVAVAPVPGDADRDGMVDHVDAAILAAHWRMAEEASWADGDFNGDGRVNDVDVAILTSNWITTVARPPVEAAAQPRLRQALEANSGVDSYRYRRAKAHDAAFQEPTGPKSLARERLLGELASFHEFQRTSSKDRPSKSTLSIEAATDQVLAKLGL